MPELDFVPSNALKDYGTELADGNLPGRSIVHKFGALVDVSSATVYQPVAFGEVYQTLQPAAATALRVKAGNGNDTAAGSGAREVTLQGLDETGAEVTVTVATNGTSASTATTETFIRLYRAWVSSSGTYGTEAAGSHAAAIVIENGAGGTDWLTINATNYPRGQSQIACYAVPLGKQAFINSFALTTDGNKPVDFIMLQRRDILDASAPFKAMRTVTELFGITGSFTLKPDIPFGPFPALTDLIWMARGATSPDVTVDFEIQLEDT